MRSRKASLSSPLRCIASALTTCRARSANTIPHANGSSHGAQADVLPLLGNPDPQKLEGGFIFCRGGRRIEILGRTHAKLLLAAGVDVSVSRAKSWKAAFTDAKPRSELLLPPVGNHAPNVDSFVAGLEWNSAETRAATDPMPSVRQTKSRNTTPAKRGREQRSPEAELPLIERKSCDSSSVPSIVERQCGRSRKRTADPLPHRNRLPSPCS
jgi:hypothetical protein